MNFIKAEIQKSEYGYTDNLQFVIDEKFLDEILEERYPGNYYKGLVPTINSWLEDQKEREIVWQRIIPPISSKAYAPILMCPDDCDFYCTIIIAEVENTGTIISWNRLGSDHSKLSYYNPQKIGTEVEWFSDFEKLEFNLNDYSKVIGKFEKMMNLEEQE